MVFMVIKWAAALGSVAVSFQWIQEFWVVGPVFGLVVLLWDWERSRTVRPTAYAGFLIASTLIYALVVWMVRENFFQEALPEYIVPGVLAGTVLLPLAHKVFLGNSMVRTIISMILVYGVSMGCGMIFDTISVAMPFKMILNATGAWQISYLLCMSKSRA